MILQIDVDYLKRNNEFEGSVHVQNIRLFFGKVSPTGSIHSLLKKTRVIISLSYLIIDIEPLRVMVHLLCL